MRNVSLQVQKSPVYRREGINIHSDVFISVAQAILGGIAKAQGLYEPISMVVSSSFPTRTLMSGWHQISCFGKHCRTEWPESPFLLCRFLPVVKPTRLSSCRGRAFERWTVTATEITMFTSRSECQSETVARLWKHLWECSNSLQCLSSPFSSFSWSRRLTRRQRSLMLCYAEEESDVHGSVNGVDASSGQCCEIYSNIHQASSTVSQSRPDAVPACVQARAAEPRVPSQTVRRSHRNKRKRKDSSQSWRSGSADGCRLRVQIPLTCSWRCVKEKYTSRFNPERPAFISLPTMTEVVFMLNKVNVLLFQVGNKHAGRRFCWVNLLLQCCSWMEEEAVWKIRCFFCWGSQQASAHWRRVPSWETPKVMAFGVSVLYLKQISSWRRWKHLTMWNLYVSATLCKMWVKLKTYFYYAIFNN